MRALKLGIAGALVALCALAALAVAQQQPPTVGVTVSLTGATVQAPGPVPAGPTRMQVAKEGARDVSVYFALLHPGVSREELDAAIRSDDRTGGESSLGLVWIQGSVLLGSTNTTGAVTFTLRPGLTYLVLSEIDTGSGPPRRFITTFTTSGAANGAAAPAPDATVRMAGLRFRGDATLPRQGRVRFVNGDAVPHFALAFPVRRQTTTRRLGRALRSGDERALNRLSNGPPTMVQSLISGGNVTNDGEVRFARAGRYALVCFFDAHDQVGMYRIVTVR